MAKLDFQIISHLLRNICVHFKDILVYCSSKLNIYSMKGDRARNALTIQKDRSCLFNTVLIYFKLSIS